MNLENVSALICKLADFISAAHCFSEINSDERGSILFRKRGRFRTTITEVDCDWFPGEAQNHRIAARQRPHDRTQPRIDTGAVHRSDGMRAECLVLTNLGQPKERLHRNSDAAQYSRADCVSLRNDWASLQWQCESHLRRRIVAKLTTNGCKLNSWLLIKGPRSWWAECSKFR